ncbi:BON domain-containing protein [Massilia yuzhufengensis]|uniref:Osmotically-inducible protein OsmY, contains BON domain n=1 Tax=Massilia yuzhufengensis TaxID=1164594 RepID=A0A1I1DCP3_9BURK|nr:BON domain-containing protein [Massilia yuzhufengensis]SFB70858.1 Osmotically-inducible protein OsmY, contains BON domain [Massilia yuzhufengensis]
MNNKRPLSGLLSKIVLGTALAASLSGCVALAVGGAATAALSANDRRTIGMQTEDKSINVKAEIKLQQLTGSAGHVNVTSYNRKVLLTGEVRDEAMKQAAEREVRAIDNVVAVINELDIAGPSSYTSRSNDALITTKVKASLVDKKTISATSVKVTTERGVVYLQGLVTPREGNIAADVAKGVAGVNRVVKIFEYIAEEDPRSNQPAPAQG